MERENETAPTKRDTQWYVFLHDIPRANEIVAEALLSGPGSEDRLRRATRCADGARRDLWRVNHPEVRKVRLAGHDLNFKVTVYVQEGEGAPRVWVDPNRERYKKKLMKKVRRAA